MGWQEQAGQLWVKIAGRKKIRINFWLDTSREEEASVAAMIYHLKYGGYGSPGRIFTKTIRDGIRLIWDLRQGKTDVLFELFPWIKSELSPRTLEEGTNRLADTPILVEKLERLEQLLSEQFHPSSGNPKALSAPQFADPIDEDDDDLIQLRPVVNANASQNLIKSLMQLQN